MVRIGKLLALAFLGVFLAPRDGRGQSSLDNIRTDVQRAPASSASCGSSGCSPSGRSTGPAADPDESFGSIFGELFGQILILPFAAGANALEKAQTPYPLLFADFPYQNNFPGFLAPELSGSPSLAERWQGKIAQRSWFGRLSLDDSYDFSDRVNRAAGSLLYDSSDRWGIQAGWNVLTQRDCRGGVDTLNVANANITYRYFESRRIILRAGLGANALVEWQRTDWGVNAHLDSDWFVKRPFVISTVFDAGSLGSTGLLHLRGTLGVVYNQWEAFAGYDWLQIGSTDIHGPVVGVRLWF